MLYRYRKQRPTESVSVSRRNECPHAKTYEEAAVLKPVGLGPSRHNESVVVSNEDNLIDALGLELIHPGRVGRNMGGLARGGKCAGHGDYNDLLAFELCDNNS